MGTPKAIGIEDEETEEEEAHSTPTKDGPRPFQCPECEHEEPDYDKAPAHMERHRPLGKPFYSKKGKLLSIACVKGCGRYFTATKDIPDEDRDACNNLKPELRVHLAMCDGQPPIMKTEPKKEEKQPMAKKSQIPDCPYHPELEFASGQGRGQHMKNNHPDWKTDPKLNLKLGNGSDARPASRALTVSSHGGEGGALIPTGDNGDVKSVDDILSLQTKTADEVLQLAAAHRARAQYHTLEADNLETYAKKMKDSMRA